MIPLLKRLWYAVRYDELAVRRWGRALLMGLAGGGIAFADQLAAVLEAPGAVKAIKAAAVGAGFVALMINAGDRNPVLDRRLVEPRPPDGP
jgi:hypothetical protein